MADDSGLAAVVLPPPSISVNSSTVSLASLASSSVSSSLSSVPSSPASTAALPSVSFSASPFILVTGALGFIGSHTTLELLKAGHPVLCVDNLTNSFRHVFDSILCAAHDHFALVGGCCPAAELYCIDYSDEPAMRALLDVHAPAIGGVIHFAACKQVEESLLNPLKYYRNNIAGLITLLTLLDEYEIRFFVFSSSATVYGDSNNNNNNSSSSSSSGNGKMVSEDKPIKETDPLNPPLNPYGRTKAMGEDILADLAQSNPSWTVVALRYFNPIGCDPSALLGENPRTPTVSNLLPVALRVLDGRQSELHIFGNDWATPDGTPIRDFVHVSDIAVGHLAALAGARDGRIAPGSLRTFNLGSGRAHSVLDLLDALESVTQKPIRRRVVGRRPGDVGASVACVDRARDQLGWKAERSLREACEDVWRGAPPTNNANVPLLPCSYVICRQKGASPIVAETWPVASFYSPIPFAALPHTTDTAIA
ncbi:hypothetical protein ASPZODRAFT_17933 [Penicilliopsis zonata CBS 506.65]|uniref:NAD-dependent epimerase/dehydratase domain-containing protein n=1 Tax=Penicilliopsis zonata CBS 506.65 TaxID=1073090 RepID=A0A1L9SD01_9EURO|nr:hypothetical protein ASPZODRAFT_17933 [Penicilliopsis zonata CBS 506.65]OJJ45018.1 hypothetical protein ASPZODRAFT_17933 [Penicilliopsis zonata CBS 506.65]